MANFLIGHGEALTEEIKGPARNFDKAEVYGLGEARDRLAPQLQALAKKLQDLPEDACPRGMTVAKFTLNPSYIARSYFPKEMFRSLGMISVGSRAVRLVPDRWKRKGDPRESSTTEIFVAGKRDTLIHLNDWATTLVEGTPEALDLAHMERITAFQPTDRIVGDLSSHSKSVRTYEVGLHLLPNDDAAIIERAFVALAKKLNIELVTELSFTAGNLWFMPARASAAQIKSLAEFSFVRVIRQMPTLRSVQRQPRSGSARLHCELPNEEPLSAEPRVAILDGGLPDSHPIGRWVRNYRLMDENQPSTPEGQEHGLAVSSSFLFGPLPPSGRAPTPYSYIDHLRVADALPQDPLELYRTLRFVEEVLMSKAYEFINLSMGPALPVEDDDVHAWTSVIDDLLSDGQTFLTVAAGNNGDEDQESGEARIQVPSDCVNAVAVGAADSPDDNWARADYSAIGPGRCPGVIKPDLLAFGGAAQRYFHVLTHGARPTLVPEYGTSFASPYLLRSAVGVRAVLGASLSPLSIKALLVHAADASTHDTREVGWGRVPEDLMDIIECPDGVARVVYQGELKPNKYLRAALPIPHGGLTGMIELTATFCYASPTDPQDAASYTRAGLEVVFRPSASKVKEGKANAETDGFFTRSKYATEHELRADQGKWETVMHGRCRKRGSSLDLPVFDIHYNARTAGGTAVTPQKIPYALVLTVKAPKHADLYNDILRSYASTLVPIRPKLTVPVRTRRG